MGHKKYVVDLSAGERKQLGDVISKGRSSAKAILKARIVLKADQGADGEGWTDERICEARSPSPVDCVGLLEAATGICPLDDPSTGGQGR